MATGSPRREARRRDRREPAPDRSAVPATKTEPAVSASTAETETSGCGSARFSGRRLDNGSALRAAPRQRPAPPARRLSRGFRRRRGRRSVAGRLGRRRIRASAETAACSPASAGCGLSRLALSPSPLLRRRVAAGGLRGGLRSHPTGRATVAGASAISVSLGALAMPAGSRLARGSPAAVPGSAGRRGVARLGGRVAAGSVRRPRSALRRQLQDLARFVRRVEDDERRLRSASRERQPPRAGRTASPSPCRPRWCGWRGRGRRAASGLSSDIAHSPRSFAVAVATAPSPSRTSTVAFGAATPAITVSPVGSTRTISKLGTMIAGAVAGAAGSAVAAGGSARAIWVSGAAGAESAGAVTGSCGGAAASLTGSGAPASGAAAVPEPAGAAAEAASG